MLSLILLILALVSFVAAAGGVPSSRVNLVALGLAFYILTLLIAHG